MNRRFYKKLLFWFVLLCANTAWTQDSSFTNSVGMELILVKHGQFIMGKFEPPYPEPSDKKPGESSYSEADYTLAKKLALQDAQPGFTATISKAFYIGKFEVTQAQWQQVMGNNPSVFQKDKIKDDTRMYPVENISWQDAQLFLKKLNALEKNKVYRLPTEMEWEWAARGGNREDILWAEIRASAQIGTRTTNKVGGKAPNAWGLYDMLGNVWEWVADYYNEKLFADPAPPTSGKQHVLKGASFVGDVKNATFMTHAAGPGNGWDVGFRVVMEVKE